MLPCERAIELAAASQRHLPGCRPLALASSWITRNGLKGGLLAALVGTVPCIRRCARSAAPRLRMRQSAAASAAGTRGPRRRQTLERAAADQAELDVLCINLACFEDRWQHCLAWAARAPGARLARSEAVDGRVASEAQLLAAREHWKGRGPFQPGMWGCFQSHMATWRQIALGTSGSAVVVEDDAGPCRPESFCEDVHGIVDGLASVEGGWDLVLLDEHEWMATSRLQHDVPLDGLPPPGWSESRVDRCWQRLLQDGRRKQNAGDMADQAALYRILCRLYDDPPPNDDGSPGQRSPPRVLRVAGEFEGTHGLLWSQRGAQRALALAERDGVCDQVDAMLCRWAEAGELSIFKTFPPLMRVEERLGRVSTTQPGRGPDGLAPAAA